MSFAKSANNCSINVDDLGEQSKPTLVEINLRADKSIKRSVSRGRKKKDAYNDVSVGSIGVIGSQTQTIEDNFRNQLLMTSLNDAFIEQWSQD